MTIPAHPEGLAKIIQIFKPGTHTPMKGGSVTYSDEDVAAIAAVYDPAHHQAPVVAGHPKDDDPALGWVKSLQFKDGILAAELEDIDPAFDKDVNAGLFRKTSVSLYGPDHPANPTPGSHHLKHVGILGAAVPAVKGLKPITEAAFADRDDIIIEFGEPSQSHLWGMLADFISNIRDSLVEDKGKEEADKIIEPFRLSWLREEIATAAANERAGATDSAYSEVDTAPIDNQPAEQSPVSDPVVDPTKEEPTQTEQTETKEATVPDDEELKAREVRVLAREQKMKVAENTAFVEGLAKGGKPIVGDMQSQVLGFMSTLDDTDTVEFGEGDGKTKATPLAAFKAILSGLPKAVEFGAFVKGEEAEGGTVSFTAPAGETVDPEGLALHGKALEFQAQNTGTSYLAAVKAVGGK